MNDGDYEGALALLDRARELTEDADLLARIELTAGYIHAQTGNMRSGFATCRALLKRRGLSPETKGLIWSQLALMHKYIGDHRSALADYTTAIELLHASSEMS